MDSLRDRNGGIIMECNWDRCGNLLQNPGFEGGLSFWSYENVSLKDEIPPEGTQAAQMNAGPSSLFQDVALTRWDSALLLAFIAYEPEEHTSVTNFIAEVQWLDANHGAIGAGLRANLTNGLFGYVLNKRRITFVDVTGRPPANAVWARVLFSKGDDGLSALVLDNLMLAPIAGGNLVQNPGFELGLNSWTADHFEAGFSDVFEGRGVALQQRGTSGQLYQDIMLGHRSGTPYLLSFAAKAFEASQVGIRLLWLNFAGQPLAEPGIDVFVNASVLPQQENYASFLIVSEPAPDNAIGARVQFTVTSEDGAFTKIDQVLLMAVATHNLLQNPGFALGLDDWSSVGVTVSNENPYIGGSCAVLSEFGAALWQDARLPCCDRRQCLLFSFALRNPGLGMAQGNLIAQVSWLDVTGQAVGLGARVITALSALPEALWQNYVTITGRPPEQAVAARVQFTRNGQFLALPLRLDTVVLASLT